MAILFRVGYCQKFLETTYIECAEKKIGIVKWMLQEQEITAILNITAVRDIQKGM
jgi:hypothetical protein